MTKSKKQQQGAAKAPAKGIRIKRNAKKAVRSISSQMEGISLSNKSKPRQPTTKMEGKSTVINHTETYGIGVIGSELYSVNTRWALQPGIDSYSRGVPLGSWLPQIAKNFDHYEINRLKFKFRSACSTLTPGLVMFGFEPNPEGTTPQTYQELRNMYSIDGSVHANLEFDVSSRVHGKKLIRKGNVATITNYDVGAVYLATIGTPSTGTLGFVDVEYTVRLSNPQAMSTSTEPVPVNPTLPFPTQRYSCLFASDSSFNAANDSYGICHDFVGSSTITGAALSSRQAVTYPVTTITSDGTSFKSVSANKWAIQMSNTGRYRLTWRLWLDYEDLKMFAINLFKVNTATIELATRQIYPNIDGGAATQMPVEPYFHRGFTGTVTGDPNPATDVQPSYEWNFDCYQTNDKYIVGVGVATYNGVSSTTANVIGRTGTPRGNLVLEYLGPLVA